MSLSALFAQRIGETGPISLADYMADCLLHPEFGYYATRDPFGAAGDFITAPEISQMFGELIGLALAQSWLDQGAPSRFTLAELGPGRGTLMRDLLRATRGIAGFHAAADLVLVEPSPKLRAVQGETLANHPPRWLNSASDLPDAPLFLVANEVFDALPIRQFQRAEQGWNERCVALRDGMLTLGLAPAAPYDMLAHRVGDTKPGDLVELCAPAHAMAADIAAPIARHGGAALIIDYGDWRSLGDTLQALHAHMPVPILQNPGHCDLTAHVDFEPLANAARNAGCAHSRLTPQGVFLERLGITERAKALAHSATPEATEALISAHRRLTHPAEMGNLFKVLGLFADSAPPPPGLER
ncbi:MAG: class I SAM-dependent methyltransferase [Sedimentitalea sp.]